MAAVAMTGCEAGSTEPDVLVCDRIFYGDGEPSVLQLSPNQRAAIVAVFPTNRETICTGVMVAPAVIVTAAHCVESLAATELRVGSWTESSPAVVVAVQVHPTADVAVLWVEQEALHGVEPIPVLGEEMDEGWVGHAVELAGVGRTEDHTVGAVVFVAEPMVGLGADVFVVDGGGSSGACGGDSGGPALARDSRGRVRVVGFLERGHASCVQEDVYTRADAIASWWPFGRQDDTGTGCGPVGPAGLCVRDRSLFCDGAELIAEDCEAGTVCGRGPGASHMECIDPEDDQCRSSING